MCVCVYSGKTCTKNCQFIFYAFFKIYCDFSSAFSSSSCTTATTTTVAICHTPQKVARRGRRSSLCCFRGCQFVSWQFLVPLQKFFMKTLSSPCTACSALVSTSARSLHLAVFVGLQPLQTAVGRVVGVPP